MGLPLTSGPVAFYPAYCSLFAPAVFFLALRWRYRAFGLLAFVIATAAAITARGISMLAIPREQQPTVP